MKFLLLIVLGVTLAGAKPKKAQRTEDSECFDILSEEECQMIALNRVCRYNQANVNCRKTCKVCHGCEDTSEYYCKKEKEDGLLDCHRGDHADYCRLTCGLCVVDEGTASRAVNRASADKLRTDQTGMVWKQVHNSPSGCKDKGTSYCRTKKANGMLDCSKTDEAEFCSRTCGTCSERTVSQTKNKASTRKLRRNKRGEDDCTDDESAIFCAEMLNKNLCTDPTYKADAGRCAKTCGLCFECKDVSSQCGTGIDVCGQEELEHFCLKTCNKCSQRSLSHAWKIRAKRDESDHEAEVLLAHLQKKKPECEDISMLCLLTHIDVCKENGTLIKFCMKTCNKCIPDARSISLPLKIKEQMAKSNKEAVDPLAHLMRQTTECKDISPICPHNKETDVCVREDLVHYCLKTCDRCTDQSMERALETFAKLAGEHPNVKDPLIFLLTRHADPKKPSNRETDCSDISTYCSKFIDDPNTTVDVCGQNRTIPYCLKSCNKCNQRSILPKALRTAKDPLIDLVRLETCVDKSPIHCMKVVHDNYCGKEELAKECPKACGLCGKKKRSHGALLHLDGECKDDVEHCDEIQKKGLCESFEINHICKLTCGLCNP